MFKKTQLALLTTLGMAMPALDANAQEKTGFIDSVFLQPVHGFTLKTRNDVRTVKNGLISAPDYYFLYEKKQNDTLTQAAFYVTDIDGDGWAGTGEVTAGILKKATNSSSVYRYIVIRDNVLTYGEYTKQANSSDPNAVWEGLENMKYIIFGNKATPGKKPQANAAVLKEM